MYHIFFNVRLSSFTKWYFFYNLSFPGVPIIVEGAVLDGKRTVGSRSRRIGCGRNGSA